MESIAVETRGDIAIMKMQHGKASALDLEFTQEIIATLGALGRGPTSAVVLTGSGTTVGLVDEVCAADDLLACALSKAEKFALLPAAAFALTKRQVQVPLRERITTGAAHDAEAASLWRHPDSLERVRRYVERTFKPASPSG